MKNFKLLLPIIILLMIFVSCSGNSNPEPEADEKVTTEGDKLESEEDKAEAEIKEYKEIVKNFTAIDIKEAMKKIDNKETFLLYLGFPECPDCRKFVPVLNKVKEELNLEIFYTDAGASSDALTEFSGKYKVEYVPTLAEVTQGEFKNLDVGEGEYSEEVLKEKLKGFLEAK